MTKCPRCGSEEIFKGKYADACDQCSYREPKGVPYERNCNSERNNSLAFRMDSFRHYLAGVEHSSLQKTETFKKILSTWDARHFRLLSLLGSGPFLAWKNLIDRSEIRNREDVSRSDQLDDESKRRRWLVLYGPVVGRGAIKI